MCKHEDFEARVEVNRLEDIGRFQADVTISCLNCGKPFQFIGLPGGLNFTGATCSVDGTEARLNIMPMDEPLPLISGVSGFTIKTNLKGQP